MDLAVNLGEFGAEGIFVKGEDNKILLGIEDRFFLVSRGLRRRGLGFRDFLFVAFSIFIGLFRCGAGFSLATRDGSIGRSVLSSAGDAMFFRSLSRAGR